MKNKDKSRELVKQGIYMHLNRITLKEVDIFYREQFNKFIYFAYYFLQRKNLQLYLL